MTPDEYAGLAVIALGVVAFVCIVASLWVDDHRGPRP